LALSAPLLLTGCLWGPGKFASELTLRKDASFVLNYRGEIVLQLPPDQANADTWKAQYARCYKDGRVEPRADISTDKAASEEDVRPCTAPELAKAKTDYEKQVAEAAVSKRRDTEEMAKAFGLPGLDDASNRAFAAKLMKYAGWRSVTYRGK